MAKNKLWGAMAAMAMVAIVPSVAAQPSLESRQSGLPAVDGSLAGAPSPQAIGSGAESARGVPESPWLSRALFVERKEGGKWSPWAIVPLASGKESAGGLAEGAEPRFAIWHEGEMRPLAISSTAGGVPWRCGVGQGFAAARRSKNPAGIDALIVQRRELGKPQP